ncbi:hypothetical protein BDM02DRAFT_3191700 [Thelephora ganbajun]|uniref:Uncharacterized protein n=1 Tax=Thelephora ganbajun TaxID=370292 RepID=A0ACB6Z1K9_THEGA|nr:hypothetical protein BDM02DRAFT_3191700 [Thelephora ganbajun]
MDITETGIAKAVDISRLPLSATATVVLFIQAMDLLSALLETITNPELITIKEAAHEELHLLRSCPRSIPVSSIIYAIVLLNISALCPVVITPGDHHFLYQWTHHDSPGSERIEAEKWCIEDCPLNWFWKIEDLMWFCTKCEVWYHLDCCEAEPSRRSYHSLRDLMEMPLLRGGLLGVAGTVSVVFCAARIMQKIQAEGGTAEADWKELMDDALGCGMDHFLEWAEEVVGSTITADIRCPKCGH